MKQEEDILRGCGKGGKGASISYFGCTCMCGQKDTDLEKDSPRIGYMRGFTSFACLLLLFSLSSSSSSSSAGTRKVVSFFGEKELLIIHRYHLIVEM